MKQVAIYLRKSRADVEAEERGEGETLAKHRKALLEVARKQSLHVIRIREEIASGESLLHRPEMMDLLKEVESGDYDAVMVMDMDRLGRGNMQEQGLILDTFKRSGTRIITPRKTYDLDDEFDEEYSEFEAFMARKELKIINRRLQGGRVRSVQEGNYIGTRPPYGYDTAEDDRGRYLVPNSEQTPVVKMIFDWYTHPDPKERMGTSKIADRLNEMGFRSYTGKHWTPPSVLVIIKNAVYAGRIQWKKKEHRPSTTPGIRRNVRTRPEDEWIDVEGRHEPLITAEQYEKAQEILERRYHVPYQLIHGITNPLAGLVRCDMCGLSMVLRPYGKGAPPHIRCSNSRHCRNKSSRFEYVEERVIASLKEWLEQYKLQWDPEQRPDAQPAHAVELREFTVSNLQTELKNLQQQKGRLHDLLERGIYDEETYLERSKHLAEKIAKTREALEMAVEMLDKERERAEAQINIIPKIEHVIEIYDKLEDPKQKNTLLKGVLEKVVYRKEKHQRNDQLTLVIYPKLD